MPELIEKETDRASTPSAFEGVVLDESMLRTDTVMPMRNQAITQPDSILKVAAEPGFDDSWFLDLDVSRFPEIWPQDEVVSGSQPDYDLYDGVFKPSPQRDPGWWRNAPISDQQPVSDATYTPGELFTDNLWKIDSAIHSDLNLTRPFDEEIFDCLATDSILSEQPAVGSRSRDLADAQIFPACSSAKTRKRRRLSDTTREKAKSVRRAGACLRCRVYKEPCDENTPCQNCVKRAASMRVFKQPCYREPLGNVVPFRLGEKLFVGPKGLVVDGRTGNSGLGQVRATYPKLQWSSGDLKAAEISLVSSFGPHENTPTVKFKLREFTPSPRDNVDLDWNSGGLVKTQKLPAYAIFDIKEGYAAIETFLDQCQPHLEAYILNSSKDEILTLTLAEAHRYAELHDNETIRRALKIRSFAVRRTELQQSELNIPIIVDEESLHHGQRPKPRFLNYQVDMMMNLVIDAHRKAILKRLKSLIFGKSVIKAWYEVYLLIYLLLSTIEYACHWQLRYSAKRKDTGNYINVNFVTRSMLEEWEYSAEILITHFRCIMRGQIPLSNTSNFDESCGRAELDEQSIAYVRSIVVLVKSRETEFTALQEPKNASITSPYIWLSKLFLQS